MTSATVVVNNFNYARYLRGAIDSALAQTHALTQVVVVDDGSTDRSRAIIADYGDRVVPVLKENGGQASALNAAWRAVEGDVVIFLDADDALEPEAVATAIRLLAAPGVVHAQWPLAEIDGDGHATGALHPPMALPSGDLRDAVLRHGPEACVFPPTSGNAFVADFLRDEFPLPESAVAMGGGISDAYLAMMAAVRGRVEAVDEPLGRYRVHGANQRMSRPFPERLALDLKRFEHRCDMLATRCRELGLPADPEGWRSRSWLYRQRSANQRLGGIVGDDDPYILIDGGEWGDDFLAPRRAFPFVERDGAYWGPPADDATAIAELERLRGAGARFAAFGWPAFWWLDHYDGLRHHLESRYPRVAADDDLVVFDLRDGGRAARSTSAPPAVTVPPPASPGVEHDAGGVRVVSWRPDPVRHGAHGNFGDELSAVVVRAVARLLGLPQSGGSGRLLAVGSVLHFACTGDVVWGAGRNGKIPDEAHAFEDLDIRAVRGPHTARWLRDRGHRVPDVFGDPVLLLPRLGLGLTRPAAPSGVVVVPNLNDSDLVDDPRVVDPRRPWRECVAAIISAEMVVGSSLHAVVVAEAFGVPARVLRIPGTSEPRFKYDDYYLGTGRSGYTPVEDVTAALQLGGEPPPRFDAEALLGAFPRDLWAERPSAVRQR